MRRSFYMLGAVALLLVAADDKDEVKKEIERFEGTWKFESLELDEAKVPTDSFKDSKLVIKGDKFTYKEGDAEYGGTFKVDVSKKPKTIDITFTAGPEKGKSFKGIYELDGDTYKVCLDPKGKDRPTKFETKKGTGVVLEVLKREKKE
jgi:uncharacterized protein (TIGR03067 family)